MASPALGLVWLLHLGNTLSQRGGYQDSKGSSGLHYEHCCKPGAGSEQPRVEAEPQWPDPPWNTSSGHGTLAGPALTRAFHNVLSRPCLRTCQLKQHSCHADCKNRFQQRGLGLFCLQGQRNLYDTRRLKNNQRSASI